MQTFVLRLAKGLVRAVRKNPWYRGAHNRLSEFHERYLMSDKRYLTEHFRYRLGAIPDLQNPTSFNEKLQWLKLHWRDKLAEKCADKCAVRDFVAERGGSSNLNRIYAVYNRVEDIDVSGLPKAFVLKATHGSGWNIICSDKASLNWGSARRDMKAWLRMNYYYYYGREWVYRNITPRILCEEYLAAENGEPPMDFKVFCFSGQPFAIQVDLNRFVDHTRNFYDVQWNRIPFSLEYPGARHEVKKPGCLQDMLSLAQVLSCGFPFVRVDTYDVGGRLIFGEMTFFPGSGYERFSPVDFDQHMGKLLVLPGTVSRGAEARHDAQ